MGVPRARGGSGRARRTGPVALGLLVSAFVGVVAGCTGSPASPGESAGPATAAPAPPAAFAAIGPEYRVIDAVEGLDTPIGVAVSPDGEFLYVSGGNGDASGIARVDARTDAVDWLGDGLGAPGWIDVGSDGSVWATSLADDAVVVSTDEGESWDRIGAEEGGFLEATSVAAEGELVAVTNAGDDSVSVSRDGGRSWTVEAGPEGTFATPTGAAITPDGLLVVVNSGDGSVALSADDGATWERVGADTTGLVGPRAVAAGPEGELYATDPGAGALARSLDGGRTWWPTAGFGGLAGVAVGPDGLVYVTDGFDTLAVLESLPGPVTEVKWAWSDSGDLDIGWTSPRITGGTALTSISVTAEPLFTDEEWTAFAAELSEQELAELAEAWTLDADPVEAGAVLEGLPEGRAVRLTLVALNEVGAGEPTTLEVPAR